MMKKMSERQSMRRMSSSSCYVPFARHRYIPEQNSVSRAHLLLYTTLEIININPSSGLGLRSPEPVDGLTNCLLYEETFINSHGDMPHHDECMGQQDR